MKTIKGDLLKLAAEGNFDYICHGCNCWHTMGSGIAKQIREQFPKAYEADLATSRGDIFKLGDYSEATVSGKTYGIVFTIINLYTQFNPGANFEYTALSNALDLFLGEITPPEPGVAITIGFPLIGAGIGGGVWSYIFEIIDKKTRSIPYLDITIVEFDPNT